MKKFFSPFLLIATTLIALVCIIIGKQIAVNGIHWGLIFLFAGLVWALPVYHWASEKDEFSKHEILFQNLSLFSMGILSVLLTYSFIRGIILLISYRLLDAQTFLSILDSTNGWTAFLVAVVVFFYGWLRASRSLKIKDVQISMAHLPPTFQPLRIAQISDLHVGSTVTKRYVKRVVELVNSISPDLVIFSGDIVDGNVLNLRPLMEPFLEMLPRDRIFYSPGNHEYYWGLKEWISEFKSIGAQVLLNEGILVNHGDSKIWVAGITDPVAASIKGSSDIPNPEKAVIGGENSSLKILISHRPGFADRAEKSGFHLQVSGHTHAGQFFPWNYFVRLFHTYTVGLFQHGKMWLYVNPGTGSWGPPLRIGTTPEITKIEVRSSQKI